jgi:hypothetical protein
MSKFYVKDGNLSKSFDSIPEVITFLEKVVEYKTGLKRPDWMQRMFELGHGVDDNTGRNFVDSLQEYVEVGVLRNNKPVRCNIFEAVVFKKPEHGN